ncbi:MAG TPA: hypothetical protein VGO25_00995 [Rhodanobacteraceae bacterium]|nr:hypothetical protein [Rhodanobacteraceae bacterium]
MTSPAPAAGADVSYAVGLDGTELAIGAPGENAIAGAVYAIDCSTLPCAPPLRIAPSDIVAGDAFGTAVGVSGNTLIATASGAEPGAAYVFVSNGSGWVQQARLTPSGGTSGERFGVSASVSGDRLAIGADKAGGGAGAIYVFVRNGTTWTQEARLTAADATLPDALGSSVSLDADTLVAGAPFKHGSALGSYANGAAYVFTRDAGGWSQQAKLLAASSANGDLFGLAVNVVADRAVIGAPYALISQGAAYVFDRSAGAWTQDAALTAAAGAQGDEFGWSVAQSDANIHVGAPFAGQLAGAACGGDYLFDGTSLAEVASGSIEAPVRNEMAGWSIVASGARWIMSAPGYVIGTDEHAGAAYWFDATITVFHSGFDLPGACGAE